MKICNFCGCENDDSTWVCKNCQGNAFSTRCNKCGSVFKDSAFCPNCGTKAGEKGKECPRCGTSYFTPACPNCGYSPVNERYEQQLQKQNGSQQTVVHNHYGSQQSNVVPGQQTVVVRQGRACNKSVALILCIFLGYLGAHKFYEGKTGTGLVYLCTFGLFGFGWLFDILALCTKSSTYYV